MPTPTDSLTPLVNSPRAIDHKVTSVPNRHETGAIPLASRTSGRNGAIGRDGNLPNDEQLRALTGLRGVAALAVVIFHFTYGIFGAATDIGWQLIPRRGYLAVDLFFILSGFVLAHVYGEEFALRLDRRRFGQFLWARFARVYPVHLVTLLMLLRLYGEGTAYSGNAFILNLLLLQGPWLNYGSWNDPSWSISLEWHAYILFPLLCVFIWRRGIVAATFLAVACWLALCAMGLAQNWGVQPVSHGAWALARSLPEFAIGILVYRLYRSGWLARVWGSDWSFAIIALVLMALSPFWPTDLAIITVLPVLLLAVASNHGRVQLVLNTRPIAALGQISYSLYMVHLICLDTLLGILGFQPQPAGVGLVAAAAMFLVALVAALVMATLVSRCIEYPARSFLRGLWRRPAATSRAPISLQ